MRVGSSPIYYIPGQEAQIENFAHHLGNKEKEAFTLLQNKKILEDSEQLPAIRVALRSIKDFAIPFKKEDKILWKYYLVPENELEIKPPTPKTKPTEEKKTLDIFEEPNHPEVKKPKPIVKKAKKISKNNDKFFNKVKTFLTSKSIEILDIESFNKNELIVRAKINDTEEILIAYNKKRINEEDIIKAHKKISGRNCKYRILCLGEPLKKTKSIIKAVKDLKGIEKIEDINKNL